MRLKGAYSEGFIKDSLSKIGSNLNESRNTTYNRLLSLEKLGWVERINKDKKSFYKLISYRKLYVSLGFKLKKTGNGFDGCHSIYKIPTSICKTKKELEALIAGYDHIRRSQRMTIQHFKSLDEKKELKRDKRVNTNSVLLPLSCQGSATILGYKSAKKGHQIQKKLESMGVINIKREKICKGKIHAYTYKMRRDNTSIYGGTAKFVHDSNGFGFVYENKCNQFKIGSILPFLSYNSQNHQDKTFAKKAKASLGF